MSGGGSDGSTYDPRARYGDRVRRFAGRRDQADQRADRIGSARVGAFLGALALLVWREIDPAAPETALASAAALLLIGFVVLVAWHRRTRDRVRRFEALRRLNERAIARVDRDWDALAVPRTPEDAAAHPFARDLDLFGRASVAQLLGTTRTAAGQRLLDRWLLEPAPRNRIPVRQDALADLADHIDLRDELAADAWLGTRASITEIEAFLDWTASPPTLLERPGILWAARLLPVATVALAALRIAGTVTGHYWLLPLAAGIVLDRRWRRSIHRVFDRVFARPDAFDAYPGLFARIEREPFDAPRLLRLRRALLGDDDAGRSSHALRRLARVGVLADARFSSIHALFQPILLWDFHVLSLLKRWQRDAGRHARRWFDALAEVEALAGLAALAHAEPAWSFPTVAPRQQQPRIEATALGHPLLARDGRVDNDLTVGPPGSFLFVTGSNMSGKSTLLRAIGVNAVLAQAGGPVCAAELRMPPLTIRTSIRVDDSLAEGISFFMAELRRLKDVVDAADELRATADRLQAADAALSTAADEPPQADDAAPDSPDRTLLYLLDEMLQGTNTRERRIAARRIMRHLLDRPAIGAVTSHDLHLVDSPALADARRDVHFTESIRREDDRPVVSFDYRLRPGLATTTNALALMEVIGLDVEEGEEEAKENARDAGPEHSVEDATDEAHP